MIYTDLTKKALKIAYDAHKDQVDKTGLPYIFHPFHLAEQMNDEASTVVALLHDVLEDSDYPVNGLIEEGFPKFIIDALVLLTHSKEVPYLDYVKEIKKNPLATKVKLADLEHNSDLTRLDRVTEADLKRLEKYQEAIRLLKMER